VSSFQEAVDDMTYFYGKDNFTSATLVKNTIATLIFQKGLLIQHHTKVDEVEMVDDCSAVNHVCIGDGLLGESTRIDYSNLVLVRFDYFVFKLTPSFSNDSIFVRAWFKNMSRQNSGWDAESYFTLSASFHKIGKTA
jgi:hypothetical protein